MQSIWIGFDPREADAFAVARNSTLRRLTAPIPVHGLMLADLQARGLYTRPTERRGGQLWDVISDAPCSTEFSITRFIVPYLCGFQGFAVFMDCDVLARCSLARLFELADPTKAVQVVKHDHQPAQSVKMDGQIQTAYPRKNWSSVVLWNCAHPANRFLVPDNVNALTGRELHGFTWIRDEDIGELPVEWNWLAGHSDPAINPRIVHFTDGIPSMDGYSDAPYADEWRAELRRWAA
jgi:lipopolysaccharide biosynthesis glycosyltransferase